MTKETSSGQFANSGGGSGIHPGGGGGSGVSAVVPAAFVSVGTFVSGTGNVTGNMPASYQVGDLLIAHFGVSSANPYTGPGGWTALGAEIANGSFIRSRLYGLIAASTSETAPTFTGSGGDGKGVVVSAWRHTSLTLDTAQTTGSGTGATMTAPAVTTASANAMVLHFFYSGNANNHGSPSRGTLGYGGASYHASSFLFGAFSMAWESIAAAGSVGTMTMAQGAGADAWVAQTIALKTA